MEAPKRVNTEGFACPNQQCPSSGITDAHFDATFRGWQAWPCRAHLQACEQYYLTPLALVGETAQLMPDWIEAGVAGGEALIIVGESEHHSVAQQLLRDYWGECLLG